MGENNQNISLNDVIEWLDRLHKSSIYERGEYVAELRKGGEKVTEKLNKLLSHPNGEVRCDAAWALLLVDNWTYMQNILPLLKDQESYVREFVAGILHDYGDERAIEPLLKVILEDNDSNVRHTACYALGKIGDERAIPALEKVANYDNGTDYEGRAVKDEAKQAITKILNRRKG